MKRSVILVMALLALCMSAPIASSAAVPGPASDASLRWARTRVERDFDMLQRDNHDYDGHRVKAIADLQGARYQILLGLGYDANHDYRYNASGIAPNAIIGDCGGSDANLRNVRRDVENVIDVLQRDNTDYGGHRVNAIGQLQAARQQIVDALIWDATH
jgi:hypothetical protein